MGYDETTLIPICEGTPMLHAWQAQPLAAKAIHEHLNSLLMLRSKVKGSNGQLKDLAEVISSRLPRRVLEDVTVRSCFVAPLSRARMLADKETADKPSPAPDVIYALSGNNNLILEGAIREETAEVLFETDGHEMTSLASMILDAIIASPIDCRVPLAENIVFIGGTSMIAGLKSRLVAEVKHLQQHPKYARKISIQALKVHRPPAKANYVAWLGAAILGATEAIATRSFTRDIYLQTNRVPDWNNLADNAKENDRTG